MQRLRADVYELVRNTVAKTWGVRIKELRKARGWSQTQLGVKAGGLSSMTISAIERGANTTTDTLEKIADALGVGIGSFFTLTPEAEDELVSRIFQRILDSNLPTEIATVVHAELRAMVRDHRKK